MKQKYRHILQSPYINNYNQLHKEHNEQQTKRDASIFILTYAKFYINRKLKKTQPHIDNLTSQLLLYT